MGHGLALGAGTTFLGYADLVFMSSEARLKCPFTDLAVAPEAASSFLLPRLIGRQTAAWVQMSSEWSGDDQALAMGRASEAGAGRSRPGQGLFRRRARGCGRVAAGRFSVMKWIPGAPAARSSAHWGVA